jgi:hypothetical protein
MAAHMSPRALALARHSSLEQGRSEQQSRLLSTVRLPQRLFDLVHSVIVPSGCLSRDTSESGRISSSSSSSSSSNTCTPWAVEDAGASSCGNVGGCTQRRRWLERHGKVCVCKKKKKKKMEKKICIDSQIRRRRRFVFHTFGRICELNVSASSCAIR